MPKKGFLTKAQREAIDQEKKPRSLPNSDDIRGHVQVLTSDLERVEEHHRNSEEPEDALELRILTAFLEWEISKLDKLYNRLKEGYERFLRDLEKVDSVLTEDLDLIEPDVDDFTSTRFPRWKIVLGDGWRAVTPELLEFIKAGEEPPSEMKEDWEEHGFNVDQESERWKQRFQRVKQDLEPVNLERVDKQVREAGERRRVLTRLLRSVVEDHEEGRNTEDGENLPLTEMLSRVAENGGDLGLKLEENSKRRANLVLGPHARSCSEKCGTLECGHLELIRPGYETQRTTLFKATERGHAIDEALKILREEAFSDVFEMSSPIPWEERAAKLHKFFSSWRSWTRPEK